MSGGRESPSCMGTKAVMVTGEAGMGGCTEDGKGGIGGGDRD